jgi:ABC-type Fe3+ transport system permease subunit
MLSDKTYDTDLSETLKAVQKGIKDRDEERAKTLKAVQKNLKDLDKERGKFDKEKHDHESRLKITQLFLKWYFALIVFSFCFAIVYNFAAAYMNDGTNVENNYLPYLDVSNTVSIITTTLSSGVGFVIGYYFKNKGS